ncbi:hypothetical protein MMPV_004039 [Pyropia vietnamensis]
MATRTVTYRAASHAGSWYTANGAALARELSQWLEATGIPRPWATGAAGNGAGPSSPVPAGRLRAIIAPHAGYAYSGPVAAYAYACIDPAAYDRVVVLGPSHHVYMPGCAVSTAAILRTPVGDLTTDDAAVAELRATGLFSAFDPAADEAEHSIEMHLPYLAHVFRARRSAIRVTCVVVGSLSTEAEATYGAAMAPLLLGSPRTLTVVSSDFCHWGRRFRYTRLGDPPPPAGTARHAAIEAMDREGMALIERQDVPGWSAYLKRTGNTICGRHPIGVLLRAVDVWQGGRVGKAADAAAVSDRANGEGATAVRETLRTQFLKYAQSSPVVTTADSSVSYASAVTMLVNGDASEDG